MEQQLLDNDGEDDKRYVYARSSNLNPGFSSYQSMSKPADDKEGSERTALSSLIFPSIAVVSTGF